MAFILAVFRKPSKGNNSLVELAFSAAKSAHGSARVPAGVAFQHWPKIAQRGNREPIERK
jgi:hypothetical protein